MIIQNDIDKFGFYLTNGRKTYSKLEAFELSGHDFSNVEWNFNQEVFSSYNWKVEPEQDLNYFYDKRAKELREKYDYIVLLYSGGYDSHNILKTFIDNNLHIDEILNIFPQKNILNEETFEYKFYTENKLLKYKDELINTKITPLEYVDMFFDMVKNDLTKENILYGINSKISISSLIREKIKKDLYSKYHEKGKKICFLYGIDKPLIRIQNNPIKKFYTCFSDDIIATYVSGREQLDSDCSYGVDTEFFYWDPNCVSMMIKQAHLIKKKYLLFSKSLLGKNIGFNLKTINNHVNKILFDETILPKSELENMTIYPRCAEDINLRYFNSGISGFYHSKIEKIFNNLENMKKHNMYRCMGARNAWFYKGNSDEVVKMRKTIEHLTSMPSMFTGNDVYQQSKTFLNVYEI